MEPEACSEKYIKKLKNENLENQLLSPFHVAGITGIKAQSVEHHQ
jgi:hypothetical protein